MKPLRQWLPGCWQSLYAPPDPLAATRGLLLRWMGVEKSQRNPYASGQYAAVTTRLIPKVDHNPHPITQIFKRTLLKILILNINPNSVCTKMCGGNRHAANGMSCLRMPVISHELLNSNSGRYADTLVISSNS